MPVSLSHCNQLLRKESTIRLLHMNGSFSHSLLLLFLENMSALLLICFTPSDITFLFGQTFSEVFFFKVLDWNGARNTLKGWKEREYNYLSKILNLSSCPSSLAAYRPGPSLFLAWISVKASYPWDSLFTFIQTCFQRCFRNITLTAALLPKTQPLLPKFLWKHIDPSL